MNLDLVYDRLVADEKLKSGTKFERPRSDGVPAARSALRVYGRCRFSENGGGAHPEGAGKVERCLNTG